MRSLKWFGLWTLLGGIASVQLYFAHQRLGPDPWGWGQALEASLPAWYLWGLLSLVVVWLARRFQVDRANFGRHFFIHLGGSLDIALLQLVAAGGIPHLLRSTLTALEQRLDPERFRRINRSAVVNLDRVRELQPWFHGDAIIILQTGTRVTLSRRYRDNLLAPSTS